MRNEELRNSDEEEESSNRTATASIPESIPHSSFLILHSF
jgi:hypothetical protein